jgi:hypothetical protein
MALGSGPLGLIDPVGGGGGGGAAAPCDTLIAVVLLPASLRRRHWQPFTRASIRAPRHDERGLIDDERYL